jgi:rhamnogalacturonan endolyase
VTFSVTATGTPPPTYQWRKDGVEIDGATSASYTIPNVVVADSGSYDVVVTNSTGSVVSTAVSLLVSPASASVTLSNLEQRYDGTPRAVTAATTPAGKAVSITYAGSTSAPIYPGVYEVVATITDPNYTGSASDVLVITTTALVRHAPMVNGKINGSVQVLLPEATTLNSSASISGDLLMPGTPRLTLNGKSTYGGTIDASGSATPSNYNVTLNSATLRHLVRRVNAIIMPTVSAPPMPAGNRNVTLNNASQSPGNFVTLRNLTLNSNVGTVAVPPGTYGTFIVNSGSALRFGVAGATTPSAYNLQGVTLNTNAKIEIVGPIILTVANGVTLNGSMGNAAHPEWLELNVASGGVTLNSNVTLSGAVVAPSGAITINGGGTVNGGVVSDRLMLNTNATVK